MKYLCQKHLCALSSRPAQAFALWRAAMDNGLFAQTQGNLSYARSFLGSAWEIALLHVHQQLDEQSLFQLEHLLEAGESFTETLFQLGEQEEACGCIALLQEYLFVAAGRRTIDKSRRQQLLEKFNQLGLQRGYGVMPGAVKHVLQ